jgi:hypothetical protein
MKLLLNKIISALNNKSDISILSSLFNSLKQFIKNNEISFYLSLTNPFLNQPIKNSLSYPTSSFIVQEEFSEKLSSAKIIVSLDTFYNELSPDLFDICILNNYNNYFNTPKNTFKSVTKSYRVTACGIKCKARKISFQLKHLTNQKNTNFSSITKYDDFRYYFFNSQTLDAFDNDGQLTINSPIILDNYFDFFFPYPQKDFYEISQIPTSNFYLIIDVIDLNYFYFNKHVEHIPLPKYQQIFNSNINKNVW